VSPPSGNTPQPTPSAAPSPLSGTGLYCRTMQATICRSAAMGVSHLYTSPIVVRLRRVVATQPSNQRKGAEYEWHRHGKRQCQTIQVVCTNAANNEWTWSAREPRQSPGVYGSLGTAHHQRSRARQNPLVGLMRWETLALWRYGFDSTGQVGDLNDCGSIVRVNDMDGGRT